MDAVILVADVIAAGISWGRGSGVDGCFVLSHENDGGRCRGKVRDGCNVSVHSVCGESGWADVSVS